MHRENTLPARCKLSDLGVRHMNILARFGRAAYVRHSKESDKRLKQDWEKVGALFSASRAFTMSH
jgi:hypothetical protein